MVKRPIVIITLGVICGIILASILSIKIQIVIAVSIVILIIIKNFKISNKKYILQKFILPCE